MRTESWPVTPLAVACVVATGLIHALYFILLARAYSRGEISVVYPIARGSGIGITAVMAWQLLSEQISLVGLAGIGLVFTGILVMGVPGYRQGGGIRLALSVGLTIPAYSIVDKIGVSLVHPTVYIWLMYVQSGLFLWPFVRRWHGEGEILREGRRYWPYVLIIGVGASATYTAVLFAYQLGRVSYIVALREVAVVIGALLGVLVLKERLDLWKALAIGAITAGIICIKVG